MVRQGTDSRTATEGVALLMTLIFVAIFACMAIAIAAAADVNLMIARNRAEAHQAAALAETGLLLAQRHVGGMAIQAQHITHDAADLHAAIVAHLEGTFDGSAMVDTGDIAGGDGEPVEFTAYIETEDGRTGTVDLLISSDAGALDAPTVSVESTGRFGRAVRTVSYELTAVDGWETLKDYGLASRSSINMVGNARIDGADDDAEGSVLSATYSVEDAVWMSGNSEVTGDAAICSEDGDIVTGGESSIGGDRIKGACEPIWPEVQPDTFELYIEETLTEKKSEDATYENICIPAGLNPTFSGDTVLNGVIYVESPNKIMFTGNATICGIIVCEPPEVENLLSNSIKFAGNLTVLGVENLPDETRYDGLRDQTGSFLLAEGFSAEFAGNFSTVSGYIVASELKFSGNAAGTIRGGVLNLSDTSVNLSGEVHLTIDKDAGNELPAGLRSDYVIMCRPGTYEE